MSTPRTKLSPAALPLVAVLLTGCSVQPPDTVRSAPAVAAVPAVGAQARDIVLPFDAYGKSPADTETVESAEDVLIRDCMRDQGMAWRLAPRAAAADIDPYNRRRYGVVEPAIAQSYGYHLPPDRPSVARREALQNSRDKALGPRENQAAYGADGVGGCWKRAHDRLLRNAPKMDDALLDLFNSLNSRSYEASVRTAAVVRVFRAWSACMARAGFRYRDPDSAIDDRRWDTATSRPSPDEVRVAHADAQCKEQTGLVSVWSAAETRLQRAAISAHPAAFRVLRAHRGRWLEAARAVLAGRR